MKSKSSFASVLHKMRWITSSRKMHWFVGVSLITQGAVVVSCRDQQAHSIDAKKEPFVKALYQNIAGNESIVLVSEHELEIRRQNGINAVYEYSIESDSIRAVANINGTRQALYFTVAPDRLLGSEGGIYYNPDSLEKERAWRDPSLDSSLKVFCKLIKSNPKDIQAFEGRGMHYMSIRSYNLAIADFSEAIRVAQKDEDFPSLLCRLKRGESYLKKGDFTNAVGDFSYLIKLKPDYILAYLARGDAYSEQRIYDMALADINKAQTLIPALLGGGAKKMKWMADQKLAWILATAIDSRFRDGQRALVLAQQMGQPERYNATAPLTLQTLAAAYAEVGQFDKAVVAQLNAIREVKLFQSKAKSFEIGDEYEERLKLYRERKPYRR